MTAVRDRGRDEAVEGREEEAEVGSAFGPVVLGSVFAGGAVGTLARVALAQAAETPADAWPWATFAVNVLASALLALVAATMRERDTRRPALAAGLCGGLSTFATVQVELLGLLDAGAVGLALAYVGASVVCGLGAAALVRDLAGRRA